MVYLSPCSVEYGIFGEKEYYKENVNDCFFRTINIEPYDNIIFIIHSGDSYTTGTLITKKNDEVLSINVIETPPHTNSQITAVFK